MGPEIRNHISYVERWIEAHQKVLEELKKHDPELNDLIIECFKHGVGVQVDHQVRPNCQVMESHGVTIRVFSKCDVTWQCMMGRKNAFLGDRVITQHNSLAEVIQHIKEKVIT